MIAALKKLSLGLCLIAGAAAVLLYSDLESRRAEVHSQGRVMRVAMVQQISIPALDDGLSGALADFKDRGYAVGGRMVLFMFFFLVENYRHGYSLCLSSATYGFWSGLLPFCGGGGSEPREPRRAPGIHDWSW